MSIQALVFIYPSISPLQFWTPFVPIAVLSSGLHAFFTFLSPCQIHVSVSCIMYASLSPVLLLPVLFWWPLVSVHRLWKFVLSPCLFISGPCVKFICLSLGLSLCLSCQSCVLCAWVQFYFPCFIILRLVLTVLPPFSSSLITWSVYILSGSLHSWL